MGGGDDVEAKGKKVEYRFFIIHWVSSWKDNARDE